MNFWQGVIRGLSIPLALCIFIPVEIIKWLIHFITTDIEEYGVVLGMTIGLILLLAGVFHIIPYWIFFLFIIICIVIIVINEYHVKKVIT